MWHGGADANEQVEPGEVDCSAECAVDAWWIDVRGDWRVDQSRCVHTLLWFCYDLMVVDAWGV
jgi:hypothetical protein